MQQTSSSFIGSTNVPQIVIRKKSSPQRSILKKRKEVILVKSHSHPWMNRELLSDTYELPISQREDWWRTDIRVTPVPGTYELSNFIQELSAKPNSYNFKCEERRKVRDFTRAGLMLLPGGYEVQDFIECLSKKPATYRFKAGERFTTDVLNFGLKDKDINVAPNTYSIQNYLAIGGENNRDRSNTSRSQMKRIPSSVFGLKGGPALGQYNVKDIVYTPPGITSCFKSKIPRFPKSKIKHPGPGESWNTLEKRMPASSIGQLRGLFFTTGFESK